MILEEKMHTPVIAQYLSIKVKIPIIYYSLEWEIFMSYFSGDAKKSRFSSI